MLIFAVSCASNLPGPFGGSRLYLHGMHHSVFPLNCMIYACLRVHRTFGAFRTPAALLPIHRIFSLACACCMYALVFGRDAALKVPVDAGPGRVDQETTVSYWTQTGSKCKMGRKFNTLLVGGVLCRRSFRCFSADHTVPCRICKPCSLAFERWVWNAMVQRVELAWGHRASVPARTSG